MCNWEVRDRAAELKPIVEEIGPQGAKKAAGVTLLTFLLEQHCAEKSQIQVGKS